MAKKSKGKTAASTSPDPASSPPAATGTSTALASTSAKTDSLESSTGSIAASTSSSSSTQNGSAAKEVPAVDVVEDVDDSEELPDIQVNKWSLHDLKTACDDAVKQYFSKPSQFKPSHVHTDVRLGLGWTASLIAIGASLYAYKVPFQESRDYVIAAVVLYMLLSGVLAAYVKYIEKDTIFEGRRKVFAGRFETQALKITSSCEPYTPIYNLSFSYTHSSNGGKSLIREYKKDISKPFNEVFDEEGVLVRSELEKTLKGVIDEALGQ
ncbi:hypothetical protein P389DRAFT_30296 [Cystobasidium minutum MCA 4210]|uniref:uncharacterized protein n=1 Tax=Cystobasidium minutum MCA 4210 TaxID=1397322 RepID=UPI0034CFC8B5|eukprot:jgi/Rhomi1/30296/CE30295_1261